MKYNTNTYRIQETQCIKLLLSKVKINTKNIKLQLPLLPPCGSAVW